MILFTVTPPAQRVQFILGEDQNDENSHQPHPLFSEMEELTCNEDGETEWKETARYEYSILEKLEFFIRFFFGSRCNGPPLVHL